MSAWPRGDTLCQMASKQSDADLRSAAAAASRTQSTVPPAARAPSNTPRVLESHGEPAAAYQAEHRAAPRHPDTPAEPSVIVERPRQPPTLRIERAQLPPELLSPNALDEPTLPAPSVPVVAVVPPSSPPTARVAGSRVVIALFSAIAVVLAFFVALKLWSSHLKADAVAADPAASNLVVTPPPGISLWNLPHPSASAHLKAAGDPSSAATPSPSSSSSPSPAPP